MQSWPGNLVVFWSFCLNQAALLAQPKKVWRKSPTVPISLPSANINYSILAPPKGPVLCTKMKSILSNTASFPERQILLQNLCFTSQNSCFSVSQLQFFFLFFKTKLLHFLCKWQCKFYHLNCTCISSHHHYRHYPRGNQISSHFKFQAPQCSKKRGKVPQII